jgi:hypothetical protein
VGTRPRRRLTRPDGSLLVKYTLEVVLVSVTNVDRAKAFYTDKVGFHSEP